MARFRCPEHAKLVADLFVIMNWANSRLPDAYPVRFMCQVLHDAFFKHQTKPPLTHAGDLYYEGKEFEAKNQEHKPGHITAELREVRSSKWLGQLGHGTSLACGEA